MDVYASWVAAHALWFFIAVPLVTAALVHLLVLVALRLPRMTRHVLVALLLFGAFALLMTLAWAVTRQTRVVMFDEALANALSMSMSPALLWLLSWFTYLGDRTLLTLISMAMVLALLWQKAWILAACGVAATGGGGTMTWLLKQGFERIRPEHLHGFTQVTGWSFPSGHAQASLAVYGFACYLWCRNRPSGSRALGCAIAGALIAAIGVSRILLQVHFLSDVIAGFSLSVVWLGLCIGVAELSLREQRRAGLGLAGREPRS